MVENLLKLMCRKNYLWISRKNKTSNTKSSGHQHSSTSEERQYKLPTEKSVKSSTRSDGSRNSVLETLGQTQSSRDDGYGISFKEFSKSNTISGREEKYPGEQTV